MEGLSRKQVGCLIIFRYVCETSVCITQAVNLSLIILVSRFWIRKTFRTGTFTRRVQARQFRASVKEVRVVEAKTSIGSTIALADLVHVLTILKVIAVHSTSNGSQLKPRSRSCIGDAKTR